MKRVGIIGAGNIARIHVAGWLNLPVELVGYYDAVPQASQGFAEQYGGKAFTDLPSLLANVDIVDICAPAHVHKELVIAAAQAGKAIVCEKPLARSLADCIEIVETCERLNAPLFVAHVVRFFAQFAAAKAAIDAGAIGKPGVIRTIRSGSFPQGRAFFADFNLSGGVILDVGIHDIDFQRWCMGDVERVFARGLTFTEFPRRDHALITLRFTNGAVGHIESGWAAPPGQWRTRLEISGDGGTIEWDAEDPQPIAKIMVNPEGTGKIRSDLSPLAPEDTPYQAELAHFLECLEAGKPFLITPRDALEAVKTALASIESVRTGKPVTLANFQP